MQLEKFLEKVKKKLESALGDEYMVYQNSVRKNNDVIFHGIVIRHGEVKVCPMFYLDDFYGEWEAGKDMDEIVQEILERYSAIQKHSQNYHIDLSYENVRTRIVYRLVNREKNEEILKECPMIPFLDLAVTFHVLLGGGMEGEEASIRITNGMVKMWGLTLKKMVKLAEENTEQHLPAVIYTMSEIQQRLPVGGQKSGMAEIYILTNEKKLYGATSVLYKDSVKKFSQKLQTDLYLIPSSVHEFIMIPAGCRRLRRADLENMLRDVNHTHLPEEEFLSDFVYYYCREEGRFHKL